MGKSRFMGAWKRQSPTVHAAAKAGQWAVELSGGGHVKLRKPGHMVVAPATPSDPRSELNTVAQLRRCDRGTCSCCRRAET